MTIPLRERRGEKVAASELDAGGPQHIAPVVAWLATEDAGSVSNQIIHSARGTLAIMQQPAIIKAFKKKSGPWTLADVDTYMPQLLAAKAAHDAMVKEAGAPQLID
jgi:hypothetical protein